MRWMTIAAWLVAGCHLTWPLDPGSPAGQPDGRPDLLTPDLSRDAPADTPDVGPDHGAPVTDLAMDLERDLPAAGDAPLPTCPLTVLFQGPPVPANGWVLEGGCAQNSSNLECAYDQEGAAYLVKPVPVPAGCRLSFYVVGSFSGGQLDFELYEVACTNAACLLAGPAPAVCTLKTLSGSDNCSPADADVAGKTFQTVRIHRPAGTLVGSAKVSYFKVTAL